MLVACVTKILTIAPAELLPLEERQESPERNQEQRQRTVNTGIMSSQALV